jgi:hypothetical protein
MIGIVNMLETWRGGIVDPLAFTCRDTQEPQKTVRIFNAPAEI